MREAERARASLLEKRDAANTSPAPVEKTPMSEETKRRITSLLLSLGGLILIGGASFAGFLAYKHYTEKTAVPMLETPRNRFLPVVSTSVLDGTLQTRETLISALGAERSKPLADGNIKHIELMKGTSATSTLMSPAEFLLLIDARIPGPLVRAFDPLFMLGVLGQPLAHVTLPAATSSATSTQAATSTQSAATSTTSTTTAATLVTVPDNQTILLMKLDSFDNAYAGMLAWEPAMREDLLPLFQSSEVLQSIPSGASWSDVSIKNKDARVLRDASGKTRLIYSFYNQNLLIITGSEGALKTVITELDTQALAR